MIRFPSLATVVAVVFSLLLSPVAAGDAAVEFERVASGLSNPVFLTHAGDGSGRIFILEQPGRIRVLSSGELLATPFLDISSDVLFDGEQGLLGLAFHPDFEANRRFFVNYTAIRDGSRRTIVAEYRASATDPNRADPAERIVLSFDQPFSNHNGGWLGFGPDGFLYIAAGDGGNGGDPRGNGQNRNTLLGNILRIDVDGALPYEVPPDNPFLGLGGRPEIWAYGLRNPWRLSFDRLTGRLIGGDVGQVTWEEIDIVERGANYGWNVTEGPDCYPPAGPQTCNRAGLTAPIAFYGRNEGRSVTGGYVYRGPQRTRFLGRYIFGDFVSGRLWSLREVGPDEWVRELIVATPFSISSFGEDESGELYLIGYSGSVYRLALPTGPDLLVEASALGTFITGRPGAFKIRVVNQGADPFGETAVVTAVLPPGSRFLSALGEDWLCAEDSGEVSCSRTAPIPPGESSAILISALLDPFASETVRSAVAISAPDDVDPSNDSAMAEAQVVSASDVPLTYSQLALGGGLRGVLIVSNKTAETWRGTAVLGMNGGLPWEGEWTVNGQDFSGSTDFPVVLPPRGTQKFVLAGDAPAREGLLALLPENGFSARAVTGNLFYNLTEGERLVDSTGTPADFPAALFVLPVEKGAAVDTGFAAARYLSEPPFELRLTLYDESGLMAGRSTILFEGHVAEFFSELFDGLPEAFLGSLWVEADESFFLTALRLEMTADRFQLTSVPPQAVP